VKIPKPQIPKPKEGTSLKLQSRLASTTKYSEQDTLAWTHLGAWYLLFFSMLEVVFLKV
jgi:hypothetical protein